MSCRYSAAGLSRVNSSPSRGIWPASAVTGGLCCQETGSAVSIALNTADSYSCPASLTDTSKEVRVGLMANATSSIATWIRI